MREIKRGRGSKKLTCKMTAGDGPGWPLRSGWASKLNLMARSFSSEHVDSGWLFFELELSDTCLASDEVAGPENRSTVILKKHKSLQGKQEFLDEAAGPKNRSTVISQKIKSLQGKTGISIWHTVFIYVGL